MWTNEIHDYFVSIDFQEYRIDGEEVFQIQTAFWTTQIHVFRGFLSLQELKFMFSRFFKLEKTEIHVFEVFKPLAKNEIHVY